MLLIKMEKIKKFSKFLQKRQKTGFRAQNAGFLGN